MSEITGAKTVGRARTAGNKITVRSVLIFTVLVLFPTKESSPSRDGKDDGISITDESLGIDWRIPTDKAILSEKDTKHPMLKDFETPFKDPL